MKRVRSGGAPKSKAVSADALYWNLSILSAQASTNLIRRVFLLYISKSFRRLPVTMDSSCAKTLSNGLPDRTAHGLVSSNQRASRRDVIMVRQKPPVSSYCGTCPFKFTISHNSVNTNSITSALGLNDGKIFRVTLVLVRSFYPKNSQSRTLYLILTGVRALPP